MAEASSPAPPSPALQLLAPADTIEQATQALAALDAKYQIQFRAYDKAIEVLQAITNRSPTTAELYKELTALKELSVSEIERAEDFSKSARDGLKELIFEKFDSVQTQFKQNETALAAALNAAKEAVAEQNKSNTLAINKSEEAFKKLLDAIASQINATEKATDSKITDIKERVQAIENRQVGINENRKDNSAAFGYVAGAVGLLVGLIAIFGFIIKTVQP